jgi:uncharacterized protein YqgV (UPF0045/DUF77 family)
MNDSFVSIITEALEKTRTDAVWSSIDALSTVYRGRLPFVVDAARGLFVNAYCSDVHMVIEGQFSKGCPGDTDGDSYLALDGEPPNLPRVRDVHFPAIAKIALYPLGTENYIDGIAHVFRMAEDAGLNPKIIHYATRIEGDIHEIFDYLEAACGYAATVASHFALTFTVSVNSPSLEV